MNKIDDSWIIDRDGIIHEGSSKLLEYSHSHIFKLEKGDIIIQLLCGGMDCTNTTKHAATKKFKRYFRKAGNHIPPYIKIRVLDTSINRVIGICRISIYHPKYITGFNENMILTKDQIDELIHILSSINPAKGITLWQHVISKYNNNFTFDKVLYHIPNNIKMPDYTKLLNTKG